MYMLKEHFVWVPAVYACRLSAAQQLLQPGVAYLEALQQQLQSGAPWAALANASDNQVCHYLTRVRAVLEGRLLQQQRQQNERLQQQQLEHALEACAIAGSSSSENIARSLQSLHVQDMQAGVAGQETTSSRGSTVRGAAGAIWAIAGDPALQLLLGQIWPQLHSIVTQHGAGGRFLHHYGKCCSRLLKIHPGLLVPQLQQFLQIAVMGIVRPGGCTLAEPFATAIELCCMQGSGVLLESGPHIMQVSYMYLRGRFNAPV